jgi:hypothetical protein
MWAGESFFLEREVALAEAIVAGGKTEGDPSALRKRTALQQIK